MSITVQPKLKTPILKFKSLTQVSNSFLNCKSRKYDFSNLNVKTQANFRETFSQKLINLNNSLPETASKESVLNDFVNLFKIDVKTAHFEYQNKYEKSLNSFETSFHFLLQKSILQLRGGRRYPRVKSKGKKVYKYGFSRKERLLSPAHFACLLEDLISEMIDSKSTILIRREVAKQSGIETSKYKNSFSFWTAFYKKLDGKLPLNVKKLLKRKTVLKFKVRKFNNRLKNKKWALKLKSRRLKKQVKKPISKNNNKVSTKSIDDEVVKMREVIAVATPQAVEVS